METAGFWLPGWGRGIPEFWNPTEGRQVCRPDAPRPGGPWLTPSPGAPRGASCRPEPGSHLFPGVRPHLDGAFKVPPHVNPRLPCLQPSGQELSEVHLPRLPLLQ